QINISIPTSIKNSYVIGLRYVKKDGTHTEDHYLIKREIKENDKEIVYLRGQRLEKLLIEYRGTHKQQIDIPQIENNSNSSAYTPINTICLNTSYGNRGKNEDI
ncbi:MAG: hypothetical protein L6290_12055, partial [Thermodesulfovibrionales bacterium]|nr:hypothetical protein [Thermodesulfovibrionales bacterium]